MLLLNLLPDSSNLYPCLIFKRKQTRARMHPNENIKKPSNEIRLSFMFTPELKPTVYLNTRRITTNNRQ